ncbi:MAG: hypothetical protein K2X91_07780, partial [Thermoleophilia bacterium]|nr:hypothetical protein [Thermoleophilia bacterium]
MPDIRALIPAFGGAEALLRPLLGHPLLSWTIAAAAGAEGIRGILCVTDTPEAVPPCVGPREVGVMVVKSPPPTLDALTAHVLDELGARAQAPPDGLAVLLPEYPVRLAGQLDAAIALFRSGAQGEAILAAAQPRGGMAWTQRPQPAPGVFTVGWSDRLARGPWPDRDARAIPVHPSQTIPVVDDESLAVAALVLERLKTPRPRGGLAWDRV